MRKLPLKRTGEHLTITEGSFFTSSRLFFHNRIRYNSRYSEDEQKILSTTKSNYIRHETTRLFRFDETTHFVWGKGNTYMSGKTVILLTLIIIGLICVNLFVSNGFIRLLAIAGILGITFVLQGAVIRKR